MAKRSQQFRLNSQSSNRREIRVETMKNGLEAY